MYSFLGMKLDVVCIVNGHGNRVMHSPYETASGNKNQGSYSLYVIAVGIKIEIVCTVILARFSRQLGGRKFDCEISEFIQLVEHCGRDNLISDFCCTLFLLKKIKFSLSQAQVFPGGWGFAWVI